MRLNYDIYIYINIFNHYLIFIVELTKLIALKYFALKNIYLSLSLIFEFILFEFHLTFPGYFMGCH